MPAEKASTQQQPASPGEHEAVLGSVLALANLFSNCVEAFGLIHSSPKWDREEHLLLSKLGIQQARLLIWGDVLGITSPPLSVTDRAVPKHPSAAYPDLTEPTFFAPRDPRLDEPDTRRTIEDALSAIVDRSSAATREEMMEKYGLKPPKRSGVESQPALDMNRLYAFRERYELLKEVAESYAHLNTRRNHSIVQTAWVIVDMRKFAVFIDLTKEKIDFLIESMGVTERIDRAMKMDIKALGWHLTADKARIAYDTTKLTLIQDAAGDEYPDYTVATQQALNNIEREKKEELGTFYSYPPVPSAPAVSSPKAVKSPRLSVTSENTPEEVNKSENNRTGVGNANGNTHSHHHDKPKRNSIFKFFKRKSQQSIDKGRPQQQHNRSISTDVPARSKSDSGPTTRRPQTSVKEATATTTAIAPTMTNAEKDQDHNKDHDDDNNHLEPIRSKSVGAILDGPVNSLDEEILRTRLARLATNDTMETVKEPFESVTTTATPLGASISRHDQYRGLGRQETRMQI